MQKRIRTSIEVFPSALVPSTRRKACFLSRSRAKQTSTRATWQSRRTYATAVRDYNAAVARLNTLQSNFAIVTAVRNDRDNMNARSIPEMIDWCKRIGYEPTDFDHLNPIHIAGTKGKGSTSSFISSILAQYLPSKASIHAERLPSNVGLYTSPHLRFVRERIQINNEPLSEELFAKYFFEIWDRLEKSAAAAGHAAPESPETKPVYFRYLTLMALHCYMREEVGTAVVECGIGGEYDSTNILIKPSITGVTSLGIDHTALLGDTLESIAWHKAGIFKPGVPAFTAPQPDSALEVLQKRAQERGTEVHVAPAYTALDEIKLGLYGDFQKTNASLAVALSAAHLQRMGYSNLPDPFDAGSKMPPEFVRGLENVRLDGRCDKRKDDQQPGITWFIDGGHTMESIQAAGHWYASEVLPGQSRKGKNAQRMLIFNQQTRDAASLARHLHSTIVLALKAKHPFKNVIFCTNTTYKDAGFKADLVSINTDQADVQSLKVQQDLARGWDSVDPNSGVHICPTIEEAIAKARELSEGQPANVMITGSLHLVGGVIEVLESEKEGGTR